MNTLFLTRPDMSDDTVYKVTKAIVENVALGKTYHRDLAHWNVKNSLTNVQLPFHPGAVRYYKDKGVWTAALEATQKRLLK
jgi:hypothetical protein